MRERERGEWLRGRGRGEEREREREVERERAEDLSAGADLLRGHRGRRRWARHHCLPRYGAKGSTNLPAAKGHCQAGRRGREGARRQQPISGKCCCGVGLRAQH